MALPRLNLKGKPWFSMSGTMPLGLLDGAAPRSTHAFDTPLLKSMLAERQTDRLTDSSRSSQDLDSSRSGISVPKNGVHKLEVTVINHPKAEGVVVSRVGADGACAHCGLNVGDHILKINDVRARDHRQAMWVADAAESRVRFSLADASHSFVIDRTKGEVGVTLVNNTTAGYGVVVVRVVPGLGADRTGLEVGHVILSANGQLAMHHREVIGAMDASKTSVELVVAARKLTEANVVNQYIDRMPITILVEM